MSEIRNALRGGYDAYFFARSTGFVGAAHLPQRTNSPYRTNPNKDLWLRGWKEAEKSYFNGQFLQAQPFETVPGLRSAANYYEIKARSKAGKHGAPVKVQGANTGRTTNRKPNFVEQDKRSSKGGVNLSKLNRFAQKHRTVA